MTLEVIPAAEWADAVAGRLADAIAANPSLVLCLPTGSTPLPVYDRLPGVLRDRGISAAGLTVVGLDEFLGLPQGHRARCDTILRHRLLDRLEPPVGRFIAIDVDGPDPEAACAAIDAEVAEAGGIDLVVLGLGRNGHVGMNEPGSRIDSPTRVVELTPSTRDAAIGYGADPPPTHGVTLGMAPTLAAREIWLLATGPEKREILHRVLEGPASAGVPATLLLGHPGITVVADADALRRPAVPGGSGATAEHALPPRRNAG